ncbi:LmeA family phospholipid-binding protein [Streptomyces sp. KR80]|uniref:LmeA family phospholipid-binding protein n=1 Tax=Streptomyces sp. KR80 TaxID=3457426 RepID=UPI003FD028E7
MRALRIVLIFAVVLGGLFVAADRLAVGLAEDEAAEKLRSSQNLSGSPQVSIKGFPFLTQVADQRLDEVDVTLDGITASAGGQGIRVTEMNARLLDVRLENNFSSATATSASGSVRISYRDLSSAAPPGLTIGYAGEKAGQGRVKITGEFPGGISGTAISAVSVAEGDTIRVRADDIEAPGSDIALVRRAIRKLIDYDRDISGLPQGLALDTVEATRSGVDISVTGNQVKLAG